MHPESATWRVAAFITKKTLSKRCKMPYFSLVCSYLPCSKTFQVHRYRKDIAKFCSKTCHYIHSQGLNREEKFWSRVRKTETCWIWTGGTTRQGYGTCWTGTHTRSHASRVAYEITYGTIPNDLFVLHICDTPICVRPDHLFLGNAADNIHDAIQKGRARLSRLGELNAKHKLTKENVLFIRSQKYIVPALVLAKTFSVSRTSIYAIWNNNTWKHI